MPEPRYPLPRYGPSNQVAGIFFQMRSDDPMKSRQLKSSPADAMSGSSALPATPANAPPISVRRLSSTTFGHLTSMCGQVLAAAIHRIFRESSARVKRWTWAWRRLRGHVLDELGL